MYPQLCLGGCFGEELDLLQSIALSLGELDLLQSIAPSLGQLFGLLSLLAGQISSWCYF